MAQRHTRRRIRVSVAIANFARPDERRRKHGHVATKSVVRCGAASPDSRDAQVHAAQETILREARRELRYV